ncbi:hypothetical protein [Duganella violaceipulchra]|uniref:Uncharacterized protein n=1 Tax=Duganella violaceipulchra TaxID=2849652 RepID=A0AA41HHQ7_9BURK|nr:hypothetical protein [Duganella violaceicalia]MBV6324366.1 hypothetical protein [Duganella violaceicalia]MCP2007241.1 hypothetical protein [Duganella violaceicalia]
MSLTNDAIYGANRAPYMGADMFNSNAESSTDWNAVLTGGIVGAAQGAISQMVGGAYASGQLQNPAATAQSQAQAQQRQMMTLLAVGAVIYLVSKG